MLLKMSPPLTTFPVVPETNIGYTISPYTALGGKAQQSTPTLSTSTISDEQGLHNDRIAY
jgi:hypothetical protein